MKDRVGELGSHQSFGEQWEVVGMGGGGGKGGRSRGGEHAGSGARRRGLSWSEIELEDECRWRMRPPSQNP